MNEKMCLVFRKSACPFGQVKIKMYLPESSFFKNALAGAYRLVLMSVPAFCIFAFIELFGHTTILLACTYLKHTSVDVSYYILSVPLFFRIPTYSRNYTLKNNF